MDSNEFNSIPKDTVMVIGDMDKFQEFVAYNSVSKAMQKILFSLFQNKKHSIPLLEKYILRSSAALKDYIKTEITKYVYKSKDSSSDKEIFKSENNFDDSYGEEEADSVKVKRGDIDRLVITATNTVLYRVLAEMTNDKLVKLCWDGEAQDFMWVLRKPNEPEKVETKYRKLPPPSKRKTK
jgi:hypothetical protein